MRAKNEVEARALFVGAVARLIDGVEFTFIADPAELRISRNQSRDHVEFKAHPFLPIDAFKQYGTPFRHDIAQRYGGRMDPKYSGQTFTEFVPALAADVEKEVSEARARIADLNWVPYHDEPEEKRLNDAARPLIKSLKLDETQAREIARLYLIATQHYGDEVVGRPADLTSEGSFSGVRIETIMGLPPVLLKRAGLEGVFNVTEPFTGDVRIVLLRQLATGLGLDFPEKINADYPHLSGAPDPGIRIDDAPPIGPLISSTFTERAWRYKDSWLVRRYDSVLEFISKVDALPLQSISRGKQLEFDYMDRLTGGGK